MQKFDASISSGIEYVSTRLFSHDGFVGNKALGRISKRVFQENKARQIF